MAEKENSKGTFPPKRLFDKLNVEFHFNLDPCAMKDGLRQSWSGFRVFCNPPSDDIAEWVEKCFVESRRGSFVVLLVPTEVNTEWFQDFICHKAREIRAIRIRGKEDWSIVVF